MDRVTFSLFRSLCKLVLIDRVLLAPACLNHSHGDKIDILLSVLRMRGTQGCKGSVERHLKLTPYD